ncbi:methyltransferase domain-containing protein [Geobacter chapellei]|uniref:Methyltransferase domain-containing protein n=2 Tax=Pelotalea chapellei TaxID=44671 RepID=A0ABS5U3X9_9BACT|nr:methyltransferase domain-containing protein [Pelotalea chapellei]
MKTFLLPHLICPACLPKECQLVHSIKAEKDGDIITGNLTCTRCKCNFPIRDGIAYLLQHPDGGPSGGQWRYEESDTIDRYLWSHFADLAGDQENAEANKAWASCLATQTISAVDAGCSVGRVTFEMAARGGWAVGCDLSFNFIKMARRLARDRHLIFSLPLEGNLRESFRIQLPDAWPTDKLEFVVADALKMPFARNTFQQIASLNLLDRVSYPLAHLFEMNRIANLKSSSFLFADPFSWSTTAAPEELWLGGTMTGPYKGRGLENVRSLLEGKGNILTPPWKITRTGAVSWKMRSHCNHCELIKSPFLIAER